MVTGSILITLFAALLLIVAAAVIYFVYQGKQKAGSELRQRIESGQERYKSALWASAVITASSSMIKDRTGKDKVRVELGLEVEPPEGEPYPAKTIWWVEPNFLHLLRPGESVLIKIDRLDGMRIYPNVDWAEPFEWGEE